MLLGTLGASLLGNLSIGGKGMMRVGEGIVRAGDGIVRAGEGSVASRAKGEGSEKNPLNLLLPFHPLTNIAVSEYYKN